MARKLLHTTKYGTCKVQIYKDNYAGEFVVTTTVKGKVVGGKSGGGDFTESKQDARNSAAHQLRWLRKHRARICKA